MVKYSLHDIFNRSRSLLSMGEHDAYHCLVIERNESRLFIGNE